MRATIIDRYWFLMVVTDQHHRRDARVRFWAAHKGHRGLDRHIPHHLIGFAHRTVDRIAFMAEARVERRFTVIIAGGVAGYSRLMGNDELAPSWLSLRVAFAIIATVFMIANANAQDAEPRSYTNTPVGLNFLIAGYLYSQGKIAFDPTLSIADAQFDTHTAALAYVRSLDVWGKSAKFDVILPYSSFSAHGLVSDQPVTREMSGLGDPRFRFSMNLFGAPALSAKEFATYKQDLIIGASLQVSAPLGQYDDSKLLNLGNNRWSLRPELGISKASGPWTMEIAPGVTFFTDNTDFFNGNAFAQAPIYTVRGDIIYNFKSGAWLSLDGIYFTGGRTTLNGMRDNNEQTNTRAGLTLALPVDRYNSIKFNASTGISTRTGSEFNAVGVAWQYRWGAGY
jgi:Putative MetA-pathway of phenol degradation